MADSENPASENPSENHGAGEGSGAPRVTAGQMLRDARARAGLTVAKVGADLRVSPTVIEALEAGDYGKLAGGPYIRALLVSLSRHLRLDSREVLAAYAAEIGTEPSVAAPVSAYKDESKTHAKAHKQIFILLLAVLLFVLLLIMGKVNSSSSGEAEPAAPTSSDTLLNIDPMPDDSLVLDSLAMDSAAVDTLPRLDTVAGAGPEPEAAAPKEPPAAREPTTVRVQALSDSVYVRVLRAGRRESSRTLAPGESMEIKHNDVITFITRNSNSVEVSAGGTVVIPDKRRFKVAGTSITY